MKQVFELFLVFLLLQHSCGAIFKKVIILVTIINQVIHEPLNLFSDLIEYQ